MNQLQKVLEDALAGFDWPEDIEEDEQGDIVWAAIVPMLDAMADTINDELMSRAPDMLLEERQREYGFERRNRRRWKEPVDLLRVMIRITEECAESLLEEWYNEPIQGMEATLDALNRLCVRSLMVAREVICLVNGGFADGALGRWRSMHESAVVAAFIAENGESVAERYIAAFEVSTQKAMQQLNKYAERAGLEPFSDAEIEHSRQRCVELEATLGKGLGDEFGWSRAALGFDQKRRPTLIDLEEATGLDHWRPRYRWASQNVHSSYTAPRASLGMVESTAEVHLTGQSNSGMVDPLQMTARSLLISATSFFGCLPNADRIVVMKILGKIEGRIGSVAARVERESAKRAAAGLRRTQGRRERRAR